jgi:dTDP-4-amino-4,6-dideoxygalactose transaminase
MRIGPTLPPAAAPLGWRDLVGAVAGLCAPTRTVLARAEEIREYFRVRHVSLVSSGTAALTLALRALNELSSRSDVVIPAYTCYSVPAAVLDAGLRPVLCDIGPTTFDFNPELLERCLTDNTLCVVAHHLFGIPADIDRLHRVCRSRGIFVIEDAAQAMGVRAGGRYLGTIGDVGLFSLGRGKNITSGSGGIIVTSDDRIAQVLDSQYRVLGSPSRVHDLRKLAELAFMALFVRPSLYWVPASLPFLHLGETVFPTHVPRRRLSGVEAGVLHQWQRRLEGSNRVRSDNGADLQRRLAASRRHGTSHAYLRLPVFAATPGDRRRLYEASQRSGLGMSLGYPAPLNELPQLKAWMDERRFPCATTVAGRLLTVPTHHFVSARYKAAIARYLASAASSVVLALSNLDLHQTTSFEPVHHG